MVAYKGVGVLAAALCALALLVTAADASVRGSGPPGQRSIAKRASSNSRAAGVFSDIACVSASDCWAVGDYENGVAAKVAQVYRFYHETWMKATIPEPGGKAQSRDSNALNAVACASSSDCWAVGSYSDASGAQLNEALHWNGQRWSLVAAPQRGGTATAGDLNELTDIACISAADCWAVGAYTNRAGAYLNDALHWDGKHWRRRSMPNPSGTLAGAKNVAGGVACSSHSACLSVGYGYTSGGAEVNEALRWNGRKWSVSRVPQPGGTASGDDGYLQGLACVTATECWAAGGYRNAAGADVNQILRWRGSSWKSVSVPDPGGALVGDTNDLLDVSCASGAACWAVGRYTNASGIELNEALRFGGKQWRASSTPQPGGTSGSGEANQLMGVACASATSCWALGYDVNSSGQTLKQLLSSSGKRRWMDSSPLFDYLLDGRLAGRGHALCQALPGSRTSITKLSCEALQQTVAAGPYPPSWELAQAMNATLSAGTVASRSARQRYGSEIYTTFSQYDDGLPFSSGLTPKAGDVGATRFYDDAVSIGLDLIQAYEETHQRSLLHAAEGDLNFERTGQWSPDDPPDQQHLPGGIYWNTLRRTRPLHSTAGAAQVALELYELTRERRDLTFAEQEYRWVRQVLGNPNGLYRARVEPGGTVTGTTTNNGDGMMIASGVLLYQITGQKRYLNEARRTATASLKKFTAPVLERTCPSFDNEYLEDLMVLHKVVRLRSITRLLDSYDAWAASNSNPQTGAFTLTYPHACAAPAPQAGVTGALVLKKVR